MRSASLQPASVLFRSVTARESDCFPSLAHNEKRAAMVDGLCSSQLPLLCFTETKLHFSHGKPIVSSFDTATSPRWYRETFAIVILQNQQHQPSLNSFAKSNNLHAALAENAKNIICFTHTRTHELQVDMWVLLQLRLPSLAVPSLCYLIWLRFGHLFH